MEFLVTIFLFLIGLAMLLKPELIWKLDHFLSVKGGEPTELYIALTRLSGVFFMGVGVVCFFVFLFAET